MGNPKFRTGMGVPFPREGEPHVHCPCDKSLSPGTHVVGWLRARQHACRAATAAGVVEAGAQCALNDDGLTMLADLYRRRVAATVVELAKDDPSLVKEVIARLRAAGDIEVDDLVYLDRIADRWIAIAEGNARRGASAHPRQARR